MFDFDEWCKDVAQQKTGELVTLYVRLQADKSDHYNRIQTMFVQEELNKRFKPIDNHFGIE